MARSGYRLEAQRTSAVTSSEDDLAEDGFPGAGRAMVFRMTSDDVVTGYY